MVEAVPVRFVSVVPEPCVVRAQHVEVFLEHRRAGFARAQPLYRQELQTILRVVQTGVERCEPGEISSTIIIYIILNNRVKLLQNIS